MQIVSLSDIITQTDTLEITPTTGLTLSPIPLSDIVKLFWEHQDSFLAIYHQSQQANPDFGVIALAAPEMVCQIIAMGAGQPDQADKVSKLPITVQLIALGKIFKLTVPDPKKFVEALTGIMGDLQTANATLEKTPTKLENKTAKTSSKE